MDVDRRPRRGADTPSALASASQHVLAEVAVDAHVESRPVDGEVFGRAAAPRPVPPRTWLRRIPLLLAVGALVAAAGAALLPADPVRATYVWPPATIPDAAPERTWFAPIMLNRRSAQSLRADLPCGASRLLAGAGDEVVLLATARNLGGLRALAITRERGLGRVRVRVGTTTLSEFRPGPGGDCEMSLSIDGERWELSRTGRTAALVGTLPGPVDVNGLLTELDLRASPRMRVEVTPTPQDTTASPLQTVLRLAALIALVAALGLVVGAASLTRRRFAPRSLLAAPAVTDLVVGATLVVWWVVGPVTSDDGWVTARQTNAGHSGGFSNYYDHHAANLPYATWLESLQRLAVASTNHLVLQRIPSVLLLAALWLVVRHALGRLAGPPPRRGDAVWWSAAAVFCLGATGFGVTLRPEPVTALLVGGVLLCAMRFAARPGLPPLAAAAVLAGLALAAHPQGLVALAPLLACLPRIVRELRRRVAVRPGDLLVVCVAAAAWTVLLAFLDSDLRHRLDDASLMREGETHGSGLLGEFHRYLELQTDGAPPVRKEFVALAVIAVLVFLTRGRRAGSLELRLPALSLGLGLLLLSFTPSKWIWHFGVLVAPCALAVAVEVARLRDVRGRRSSVAVPAVFAAAVLLATVEATWTQHGWGPLDLREFFWHRAVLFLFPLLLLLAGMAAVLLFAIPGRGSGAARAAQGVARWSVPVVAVPLVVLSAIGFAVDAARADWAFARQNVVALAGRPTCGLADVLRVPEPGSAAALARLGSVPAALVAPDAPAPPAPGADVLAWPSGPDRSARLPSPWYRLPPAGRPVGVYVAGTWRQSDTLVVTWGRGGRGNPVALRTAPARVALRPRAGLTPAVWRLVAQSGMPPRPAGADAVRFRIAGAGGDPYRRFVSGPVGYSKLPLSAIVGRPSTVTLASPLLLPMIPCARLPVVAAGSGEAPGLIVEARHAPAMTEADGPFGAVPDLFAVRRLPLTDSEHPPGNDVSLYEVAVDRRDAVAPAVRVVRS